MITQAFQFEVIRLLEGYWKAGRVRTPLSNFRIGRQARKRDSLQRRYNEAMLDAFKAALTASVTKQVPNDDVLAMKAILDKGGEIEETVSDIEEAESTLRWDEHSPPQALQLADALRRRLEDFPGRKRVLPTILGNTLRSREDQLRSVEGRMEGFVIKNYDLMPAYLRAQHDQYRNRLEMYCSLVFVFGALCVLASALLSFDARSYYAASIGSAIIYLGFAALSYAAAITSARGYGDVLVMIDEKILEGRPVTADGLPSEAVRSGWHHRNLVRRAFGWRH